MTKHSSSALRPVWLATCCGALLAGRPALPVAAAETRVDELDTMSPEEFLEEVFALYPEVVVSSSGVEERLVEAASIISVVTPEQIRNYGYRSLAEAISALPGLSYYDDHVLPNLAIRGVAGGMRGWGRLVQVMIDGQPIGFQQDNTNWLGAELIPLDMVERIEVIRGPASTLYGRNAFLGAVNIITRRPDPGVSAFADTATLETMGHIGYRTSLWLGYKNESIDVLVAAAAAREDRSGLAIERTYDAQPENALHLGEKSRDDLRRPKSLFAAAGYEGATLGVLRLDGFVQHLDTSGEFQDFSVLSHRTRLSVVNGYGRLSWRKQVADLALGASVTGAAGGTQPGDHIDIGDSASYVRRRSFFRSVRALVDGVYRFTIFGSHSLKIGVDFESGEFARPSGTRILTAQWNELPAGHALPIGKPSEIGQENLGIYAQARLHPSSLFALTFGGRLDDSSVYGATTTVRGGLVVTPWPWLSIKALYGTALMAPAPDQLYAQSSLGQKDIVGNPDLQAQLARTVEIACELTTERSFFLRLDGFHTEVTNHIEFGRMSIAKRPMNRAQISGWGTELEAHTRHGRFSGELGLAYFSMDSQSQNTRAASRRVDKLLTGAPRLTARLGGGVALPEIWANLSLDVRHIGPRDPSLDNFLLSEQDPDYFLRAVTLVDVMISTATMSWASFAGTAAPNPVDEPGKQHAASGMSGYVRATNVLDARYSVPGYEGVDIPSQGRGISVGLRVTY